MKVFSKRRGLTNGKEVNVTVVLDESELFTADLSKGKEFSEKEANAIVKDLRVLNPKKRYWAA